MEKNIAEIQETELKEEKTKKIFIIFVVLLLFGGTCHYYSGFKNTVSKTSNSKIVLKNTQQKNNSLKSEQSKNFKQTAEENLTQKKENKDKQKLKTKTEIQNKKAMPQKTPLNKFKPTDKSTFLILSNKSSGKNDPFSYSESRFVPFDFDNEQHQNTNYSGTLPPIPNAGSMGTLPTLAGLPGLAPPPSPKPEESIQIKGFIGNKVIAEINGAVESLNANEKINNIRVISVDPLSYTAKFEINGKKISKTIKSLSDEHNGELQLVKLRGKL